MTLNREEVTRLVGAYDTYKGIVAKAAEVLPFSGPTIAKYWRAEGLEIKRKERKLRADGRAVHAISKINISKIIKAHETYKGDLVDATKNLPFAKPTIAKYWAEKELERVYRLRGYPRPVIRFTDEKIEEIIEAHRTYNGMVAAAARELNVSKSSVLKYWEQEDLERKTYKKNPHANYNPVEKEEHARIIAAYETFQGNASKAGKQLGRSHTTITKYWRKANLTVHPQGRKKVSLETLVDQNST